MTRHTTKNSLCSSASFMMIMINAHFILGKILRDNAHNQLSESTKDTTRIATKLSTNVLHKMINYNLACTTDDTRTFIHMVLRRKK